MQATSHVAPAREAVKRFTNKILFLSRLIKTQFMQGEPLLIQRIDFVQELHLRAHVLEERIE